MPKRPAALTPAFLSQTLRQKSNGKVCFNPDTGNLIRSNGGGCGCTTPCGCQGDPPPYWKITLNNFTLGSLKISVADKWGYQFCYSGEIPGDERSLDGDYYLPADNAICQAAGVIDKCAWSIRRAGPDPGDIPDSWGVAIWIALYHLPTGPNAGIYVAVVVSIPGYKENAITKVLPSYGPNSDIFYGLNHYPLDAGEGEQCFTSPLVITNEATACGPPYPDNILPDATVTVQAVYDDMSGSLLETLDVFDGESPCDVPPDDSSGSSSTPDSSDSNSGSDIDSSDPSGSSTPDSSDPDSSTPGSSGGSTPDSSDGGGGSSGTGSGPECLPCGDFEYFAGSVGTISWSFVVEYFGGPSGANPGTITGSIPITIEGPPSSTASWVGENVADYGNAAVYCSTGTWFVGISVYSSGNALDITGSGPGVDDGATITIPSGLYGDVNGYAATISGTILIQVSTCGETG